MRATVTATMPGQPGVVLEGVSENASLEGICLRLPGALPQGSEVTVSLEGGPGTIGTVRWIRQGADREILHGIDYRFPVQRHAMYARPFRRSRFRRRLRRSLIALIGLASMALAAYTVSSLMESLRTYDPWKKFYEPKDTERERFELLRRDEEMKRQGPP